ncbi:MAG: YwaF family protein [Clostridia bacterium]|nr:YwaF family protein [Clostridia bacterium]
MSLFDKIISILDYQIDKAPEMFGPFHFVSIACIIFVTYLFVRYLKDADDKTFRKVMLICFIILACGEIYHQMCFSVDFDSGSAVWDYPWYKFPLQFCSTPMYVLPFVIFMKDGHVRDSAMAYISSFSLFAGLAVCIYANDVFCRTAGVNVQTMVSHGLQVVMGVYVTVYNRRRLTHSYYLKAIPTFVAFLTLASVLNLVAYEIIPDETFNMFYISPYYQCHLPILSLIDPLVPDVVFFLIYSLGFVGVGALVYYLQRLIISLVQKSIVKEKPAAKGELITH